MNKDKFNRLVRSMEEAVDKNLTYKVKLTKQTSTHNNLRTPTILGMAHALPEVGTSFYLFSDSLSSSDYDSFRLIKTSLVEAVYKAAGEILFDTKNSTYTLEILEEDT